MVVFFLINGYNDIIQGCDDMKKRGFTLIEMIAVILIMALLTLIILPTIINQIRSQKQNISDTAMQLLSSATELYLSEKSDEYLMYYGETYCISLETLVNEGKLKSPVKDLSTGKEIPLNQIVKIDVNEYGEGEYTIVDTNQCKTVLLSTPKFEEKRIEDTHVILTYKLDNESSINEMRCYYGTTGNEINNLGSNENNSCIYPIEAAYAKVCAVNSRGVERCSPVEQLVETEIVSSKIYGIKRSLTTESSAWERTNDSVGLVANAQVGTTSVQNDFDSIYPWSDIKSYNYNTDTKQVTAWYGDANFKFDGSNGEVLTYIPEFYYKRTQENGYEYIYISKEYQDGYSKSDTFSVGRYTMSGSVNNVHSRSGVQPLVNHTITDFRTYARALGEEFGQLDYHYFILQLLYLVEYADYDSQAKLGPGYTKSSHIGPTISGGCDILGMHSGSVDGTDNTSVIYRGIEDIFGNIWQFVDGINVKDYQAYICYNKDQYESDKFDGCYQPIGYVNANINGNISKLGYDSTNPLILLPIEVSENATTYIPDYYYQTSGNRIAIVGSKWNNTTKAGLWYWYFNVTPSNAWTDSGARLLKTN